MEEVKKSEKEADENEEDGESGSPLSYPASTSMFA